MKLIKSLFSFISLSFTMFSNYVRHGVGANILLNYYIKKRMKHINNCGVDCFLYIYSYVCQI